MEVRIQSIDKLLSEVTEVDRKERSQSYEVSDAERTPEGFEYLCYI